jgi:hypothetical protein
MEAVSATWKKGRRKSSRSGLYLTATEMEALAFASPHRKLAVMLPGDLDMGAQSR